MGTTTDFFNVVFGADDELSGPMANIASGAAKMLAGFVAIQSVGDFLKSSLTAAIESEAAWNKLGAAVERHEGIWSNVRLEFEDFASTLQAQTGISDETIADSLQLFIDFGATGKQAMDRVRVAVDLAAGANISLESAVQLLSKASAGATEMLGRYGIRVDENLPKAEKFAAALALIEERFSGAAVAKMQTMEGQLRGLSEQWGDLKEQLGNVLLTGGFVFHAMAGWTEILKDFNDSMRDPDSNTELGISMQLVALQERLTSLESTNPSLRSSLTTQRIAGLKMEIEVLGTKLRALQSIGSEDDAINKTNANIAGFVAFMEANAGPTTSAAEAWDAYEDSLRRVNAQWEQSIALGDVFGPLGARGGTTPAAQAISDMEHFLRLTQGNAALGEDGPMSMIWEHEEEASKNALDRIRDHRTEYEQMALASTGQLTSEIAGLFVGLETDLKAVFRNIAKDYITLVLNEILKQTALMLGQTFFRIFFPAQSALIPVGGAVDTGALGKIGPGGATGAGVVNNYYGDIITDSEYINTRIAPVLERQAEYGLNRLALTERI